VGLSGSGDRDDEFAEYYAARGAVMRKTAYLLCGDWDLAEDLTQTTFIKLYRVWGRVGRREVLDKYTRRVLVRAFLDERRRPWRRERPTPPDTDFDRPARDPAIADQVALRAALGAVPPRQRATLVCRFWVDLSVEETAEMLGCSTGTVKSQTARGLAALRDVLGPYHDIHETPGGQRR
jgi:RNA polymerase sigma-70 factor (sigma-E family)